MEEGILEEKEQHTDRASQQSLMRAGGAPVEAISLEPLSRVWWLLIRYGGKAMGYEGPAEGG